MNSIDDLELELRKLPGVTFVAFREREDACVVQLLAPGLVAVEDLRERAQLLARAFLERPAVIEIAGAERPGRVRLLAVRTVGEGDEVEIHLAHRDRRVVGRSIGTDPADVARATVDALTQLGADLPFHFEAAATFTHELGEGVMVVLGDRVGEGRYGVAAADSVEQATVRATLSALNRHLASLVG